MEGQIEHIEGADFFEAQILEEAGVVGGIPWQADDGLFFEAIQENPAVVIDAGIIRSAQSIEARFTENFGSLLKKRTGHSRFVHTLKKTEEARFVFVVFVVRAVHNRRDSTDGSSIALGDEGCNGAVATLECGIRREKLGNATGKRRHEGRIRFVNALRRSLEPLPL